MFITSLLLAAAAASPAPPVPGPVPFNAENYSSVITDCDRLAGHADDPDRLVPGWEDKNKMDLPGAIAACQKAVAADPKNPRLNYQLGRVLGYSGRGKEAYDYRNMAVQGNYPQALFVIGFITLNGMNEQPKDVCLGADLIRRSAVAGRFAGQVFYPYYRVTGMIDGCSNLASKAEMLGFLKAAKEKGAKGDPYKGILVDTLERQIGARD